MAIANSKANQWCNFQVNLLTVLYSKNIHRKDIGDILGKSRISVDSKIDGLKLKSSAPKIIAKPRIIVLLDNPDGGKWTNEKDKSFEVDYLAKMSLRDLMIKYGKTQGSIIARARKLGIKRRFNKVNLTRLEMLALYNDGYSSIDIAKITGLHRTTITEGLKVVGVNFRGLSENSRIYTLNEHYFDEINTHEIAYLIGILYADGCNFEKNYGISIGLQARDKHILESFNKAIGSNRPLWFRKRDKPHHQDCYRLDITSKHMSKTLAKHGMVAAKSLILEFPEHLDPKFYNSFLLGYFDGDGSLSYFENDATGNFALEGNYEFLVRVQEILIEKFGFRKTAFAGKKLGRKTSVTLTYGGRRQMMKIMGWLYKDSPLRLHRKYEKYLEIVNARGRYIEVINTKTGEIYESIRDAWKDSNLKLSKSAFEFRLAGRIPNDTVFMRLTEYQGTQPQKQTA